MHCTKIRTRAEIGDRLATETWAEVGAAVPLSVGAELGAHLTQCGLYADVDSRQRLRSAASSTLVVPPTRRATLGDRAFPVAAARAWNSLPPSVRAATSLQLFRRELKTNLFMRSYQQDS